VSAECVACGGGAGTRVPLLEFNATTPMEGTEGCGGAPQVLAFFKFLGVYGLGSVQIQEVEAGVM